MSLKKYLDFVVFALFAFFASSLTDSQSPSQNHLRRLKKFGPAATVAMALSLAGACSEAPGESNGAAVSLRPVTLSEGEPELPRMYLDTTYTPPRGRVIEVKAGGDFQTALNQAKPGDVITLEAGGAFTGNFTLPNKSGSGQSEWIVIRSSTADSNLPPPGARVTPSYSAVLPRSSVQIPSRQSGRLQALTISDSSASKSATKQAR